MIKSSKVIVDAHVHSFDSFLGLVGRGEVRSLEFGKVRYGTGEKFRMLPPSFVDTNFPGEVLVEYMNWLGVDKAVLCQGNLYGFHNEYTASLVRRWPQHFTACALVDPLLENSIEILKYVMEELGFKALKLELSQLGGLLGLHPQMRLNDSKLKGFWESFAKYDLPLVLDLGPVGGKGYQLEELEAMLSVHSQIRTVVICHLGGASKKNETCQYTQERWREFLSMARNRNFYVDLSALTSWFDEEYPCPTAQKYIRFTFEILGADRLLWGSDLPTILRRITYQQALNIVKEHCGYLTLAEKSLILGENALRAYRF